MGWVLSCETGRIPRCRSRSAEEKATSSRARWRARDGPRAVGDPMHVETSFVRNLGGLMPPAAATRSRASRGSSTERSPAGTRPPTATIRLCTTGRGGQPIAPRPPGRCRYSVDGDTLSRSATSATGMPFDYGTCPSFISHPDHQRLLRRRRRCAFHRITSAPPPAADVPGTVSDFRR